MKPLRLLNDRNHGLQLTIHHSRKDPKEKFSYSWTTVLKPIVRRGSFKELKQNRTTITLREPIYYYIDADMQHYRDYGDFSTAISMIDGLEFKWKPGYQAHVLDDVHETDNYYRSPGSALAALKRTIFDKELRNDDSPRVEDKVVLEGMDRGRIAQMLTLAVYRHWIQMTKSKVVYDEFCVPGGKRVDMLAMFWGGEIRVKEIKSCRSDFTSDNKWQGYLKHCNRFSFVTLPGVISLDELPKDVGLYELNLQYPKKGNPLIARRYGKLRSPNINMQTMLHCMLWSVQYHRKRNDLVYLYSREYLASLIYEYNQAGAL